MRSPGRNDPCPCGSGKKFKKCCLGKAGTAPAGARGAADARDSALAKLLDFGGRHEFDVGHDIAASLFWSDYLEGRSEEEIRSVTDNEQAQANFAAWLLLDFDVEDGRTIADLFLEREGARLSPAERDFLERLRATHLALYEVDDVRLGTGFDLTDLLTGQRLSVREGTLSRDLVRWDVLAARVMAEPGGDHTLEAGAYLYPARAKREMLAFLRREYKRFVRRTPGADIATFVKRRGMFFHHFWLDFVAFPSLPQVVTAEGDELVFTKVVFDVRDRVALAAALGRHPDLADEGKETYGWVEEGPDSTRSLGTLTVRRDRLVLATVSKARAERGRALVEAAAGDAVRYRATEYETVEQAMKRPRRAPASKAVPTVPPEVEAQVLREFQDRHYREWVDATIPALGGRTPRHAARLKTLRPKLVDLLKEMENAEARRTQAGRAAYDFTWVWRELELERPQGASGRTNAGGS